MSNKTKLPTGYKLLDSGNQKKLEQFGEKILIRPASLAIWQAKETNLWEQADAEYDHKKGWIFSNNQFESWTCLVTDELTINLTLQKNGQTGLFPEHFSYLELLDNFQNAKVLNLFAYTGLASIYSANLGQQVTHIDISKTCLDWTNSNIELNSLNKTNIKLLRSDSYEFLQRAQKKNEKYNVIIADPPSFSRISKNKDWQLEDHLIDLVKAICNVINQEKFLIVFTTHLHQFSADSIVNLFLDYLSSTNLDFFTETLKIKEENSLRNIAVGNLAIIKSRL